MPLIIERNDITKMHCDAVVNAANKSLRGGGGVDGAIHRAAGPRLYEACAKIGGCPTGQAKVTEGFDMPCRYIIHTVGPIWLGGAYQEAELLASCYRESLRLAAELACESVAFPLISSGAFGYPKEEALHIAVSEISAFLLQHDMTVYIVVYDREGFRISKKLMNDVTEYIDEHYVDEHPNERNSLFLAYDNALPLGSALEKGMTDAQCYKKANIDRKLFSTIRGNKLYKPSKPTVLAFAIALELSLDETNELLLKAGFALSHSNKFDVIVEYFIRNGRYDVFEINEVLFSFDQLMLG